MPGHIVVANDVFRVTVVFQCGDQIAENVKLLRCFASGGAPTIDTQTMADAISAAFAAWYKPIVTAAANYSGCTFARIGPVGPFERTIFSVVNAGAGTAGANAMSRQSTGVAQLLTFLRGRAYQGRLYLPFPATGDDTGQGVPTAGYIANAGAVVAYYLLPVDMGAGATRIQLEWGLKGSVAAGWRPFTQGSVHPFWATQKRRGSYGRTNRLPF